MEYLDSYNNRRIKAEGLATCSSQTTSPFGCLNNLYLNLCLTFWEALHYILRDAYQALSLYRNVTICPLVQFLLGAKVVLVSPAVIPSPVAHFTASV